MTTTPLLNAANLLTHILVVVTGQHFPMVPRANLGPVQYGAGWNCCKGNEAYVVVFDGGSRWAVCARCANQYTGEVQDLPRAPYSPAKELVDWSARLDEDRSFRTYLVSQAPTVRQSRIHYLAALAANRKCIMIDKRALNRTYEALSLCDTHVTESSCNCVAPF